MANDKWRHLFIEGEYAPPKRILAELTLEQVTQRPSSASHSIYDELWHAATWQTIVVSRDEQEYDEWQGGSLYPQEQPGSTEEWLRLVDQFSTGLEEALNIASSPEHLRTEVDPGITMEDVLHSLAVHNAYHLGKIVALRQQLGAWPP